MYQKNGIPQRSRKKEAQGKSETGLKRVRDGKEERRMGSERPVAEEGALAVGSGVWSALVRPSRSASKKPSKNEPGRMAAASALVFEGKTTEISEGSCSPGYRSG